MGLAEDRPFLCKGKPKIMLIGTVKAIETVSGVENVLDHAWFLIISLLNQKGIVHDPLDVALRLRRYRRRCFAKQQQSREPAGGILGWRFGQGRPEIQNNQHQAKNTYETGLVSLTQIDHEGDDTACPNSCQQKMLDKPIFMSQRISSPQDLLLLFQMKVEELGYGVPELSEPELLFLVEPGDVPLCAPLLMPAPFVVP